MNNFQSFLDSINEKSKRERIEDIFKHIKGKFPKLKEEMKWNQPMFSDHGTFIIGFSIARNHIAVAPESEVITLFEKDIKEAGYSYTKGLFRIKWTDKIDFELLDKIIEYNVENKRGMTNFWRWRNVIDRLINMVLCKEPCHSMIGE